MAIGSSARCSASASASGSISSALYNHHHQHCIPDPRDRLLEGECVRLDALGRAAAGSWTNMASCLNSRHHFLPVSVWPRWPQCPTDTTSDFDNTSRLCRSLLLQLIISGHVVLPVVGQESINPR